MHTCMHTHTQLKYIPDTQKYTYTHTCTYTHACVHTHTQLKYIPCALQLTDTAK